MQSWILDTSIVSSIVIVHGKYEMVHGLLFLLNFCLSDPSINIKLGLSSAKLMIALAYFVSLDNQQSSSIKVFLLGLIQ